MNYDVAEMRRIGVNPSSWSWFNKDYARYQVMDPAPTTHELKQVTRVKPGRFALFLAAFCALVAFDRFFSTTGDQSVSTSFITVLVYVVVAAMCMSRRKWVKTLGFVFEAIVPINALILLATGRFLALALLIAMVAAIFGVARLFIRSLYYDGRMVERHNQLTGDELWSSPDRRVYGNPGGVASAVAKFGKGAVEAGVKGEIKSEAILKLLLKIPGVTVFHGLRFPESRNADVDHAVLHGSNLYLIDSKQYRWGEYEWKRHPRYGEQIARTDGYGLPKSNHMDAAAEGYRRILGPSVNIIPIIIVHGEKVRIGANKWSSNGVGLFTPDSAMRFMGETISHDVRTWRDNAHARAGLIRNLKA